MSNQIVVQVVLIVSAIGALVYFVRRGHNVRIRASKRVAFFAFIAVNIYAVLRPNDVTAVAQLLGIGRGTDLVVYLLVVAFVFGMINTYLRNRELGERLTELARALAVREAELANRERGLVREPLPNRDDGADVDAARRD